MLKIILSCSFRFFLNQYWHANPKLKWTKLKITTYCYIVIWRLYESYYCWKSRVTLTVHLHIAFIVHYYAGPDAYILAVLVINEGKPYYNIASNCVTASMFIRLILSETLLLSLVYIQNTPAASFLCSVILCINSHTSYHRATHSV